MLHHERLQAAHRVEPYGRELRCVRSKPQNRRDMVPVRFTRRYDHINQAAPVMSDTALGTPPSHMHIHKKQTMLA